MILKEMKLRQDHLFLEKSVKRHQLSIPDLGCSTDLKCNTKRLIFKYCIIPAIYLIWMDNHFDMAVLFEENKSTVHE